MRVTQSLKSGMKLLVSLFLCSWVASQDSASVPDPTAFFGFEPGEDGKLIDYTQLVDYLTLLDESSDGLELRNTGESAEGRPLFVAFLSAPENLSRLDELQQINRRLALDPDLDAQTLRSIINTGKVFVLATLSMHSTEVGPSQALPRYAYDLVTSTRETRIQQLQDVVWMMVPCHNPDGMDMIVSHYRENAGTPWEGSTMPGLYHRYVGHDNNRDFVSLSQPETRMISDLCCQSWFPQVMVEKHQMGSMGPRYFVPPNHDPIALNVDERLWNWAALFGSNMSRVMTARGLQGVASHWLFDDYWPGSTETSLWKGVISMLTEAASCQIAKPVFVEPSELRVNGKGLSEYKKSVNMPDPWPGGWWRLGHILEYEWASMDAIMQTASLHREEILNLRHTLCLEEIRKGREESPHFFVIPKTQRDLSETQELLDLLRRHGVQLQKVTGTETYTDGVVPGDVVVTLAQPFRAFAKEVLERQVYPVRRYTPEGPVILPYDITSWCLPLHRGVECRPVEDAHPAWLQALKPLKEDLSTWPESNQDNPVLAYLFPARHNSSFHAAFTALEQGMRVERLLESQTLGSQTISAGSFVLPLQGLKEKQLQILRTMKNLSPVELTQPVDWPTQRLKTIHVALVETYFHHMDSGWTRYLFDRYGISYDVLRPGDMEKTDLADQYDVLVFPAADKELLMKGRSDQAQYYSRMVMKAEFKKGIGEKGMNQISKFIQKGGIILAWGASCTLFMEELKSTEDKSDSPAYHLPVSDISESLLNSGLRVNGAFLAAEFLPNHPLTWGMPASWGVFYDGDPVLATHIPALDMDRRVIAHFPEKHILMSGYAEHEEHLAQKAAMVWLRKGSGQIVLFGFRPQFRASTPATYKLIFNGLLLASQEPLNTQP